MIAIYFALAGLLVFAIVAKLLLLRGDRPSFRVETVPYFFTKAENRFYSALAPTAAKLDLVVFSKVGLNDIFVGRKGADPGQYNRYAHMHVDFLLVTSKDFRPVAGIELDGSSHESSRQQERDERKNAVFKAAGLPLMRFKNEGKNSAADIGQRLKDVLGSRRKTPA